MRRFVVPHLVPHLRTPKEELQIFGAQAIHSNLVIVNRSSDHGSLLLLQRDHARLDTVLDTETGDNARSLLSNTMASISGLPFGSWVPPPDTGQQSQHNRTRLSKLTGQR